MSLKRSQKHQNTSKLSAEIPRKATTSLRERLIRQHCHLAQLLQLQSPSPVGLLPWPQVSQSLTESERV